MAKVNYLFLNQILKLLDISNTQLMQNLYVSQSLVSRWKNGTRTINSNSQLFKDLIGIITLVDKEHGICELEKFLGNIYCNKSLSDDSNLKKTLQLFLISEDINSNIKNLNTKKNNETSFQVFSGFDERLQALRTLFNKALSLREMGENCELYIFDAENYKWDNGRINWHKEFQDLCIKCMDKGIQIYIFSSMAGLKKEYFYTGWNFTSHYNLHPGYYTYYHDSLSFYSHYMIKDHMSVIFYSPNENPKEYYTAVYTDSFTCKTHYNYFQAKYRNTSTQVLLPNVKDRVFALYTLNMHASSTEQMHAMGKIPNFALSSKASLNDIMANNGISRERRQICTSFYNLFAKSLYEDRHNAISLLYYLEDLKALSISSNILDAEMTGIAGNEIYITNNQMKERLKNAAQMLKNNPFVQIFIVPKTYSPIYSILGEMLTLWCKKSKWHVTFYERLPLEPRLILDSSACALRGELFHDLTFNIPKEISSREKTIKILEALSQG